MDAALCLRGVTKTFGSTRAVDALDLTVPRGAVYGVIGPSGAGKTTCIRMIMSILFPDAGELEVLGRGSALEAKDRIGYLPEERGVYRKMRVGDFLVYIGRLKGLDEEVVRPRASRLLARLALSDVEKKRCEDLSKGMLQRVQFVATIINQPELLILDEPFSGLDPVSVRLLRELIAEEHQRGATILFSTHVMAHAEEMCEHIVMIHQGRKVLDEPMSGLRRQFDPRVVHVEPLDMGTDLALLNRIRGVEAMERTEQGCTLQLLPGSDPAAAMREVASTIAVARIELARVRLDDVFVRLVAEGGNADAARALRANLQGLGVEGATA